MAPDPQTTAPRRTNRKLHAAYRRIEIRVTEEHILLAKTGDSSHCMIADALRAAFPYVKNVSVDLASIRFTDPGTRQRYIYLTPPNGQTMLVRFDQGGDVHPFTMKLRAPVQVVHMAAGSRKDVSRALQGVAMTTTSKIPTKLGGDVPPMGPLYVGPEPGPRKKRALPDTPVSQLASESEQIETLAAVPYDQSDRKTWPNVTLTLKAGHVRRYGMKQLKSWADLHPEQVEP